MEIDGIHIERICHSCFRIRAGGKVIYTDPYQVPDQAEKADAILITHEHADHLSLEDIRKVFRQDTVVVIPPVAHPPLLQFDQDIFNLIVIGPGEKYWGEGWDVETVPAYNVDKFRSPGKLFHPKEDEHLGYILSIGGKRIYHAGDTDIIPEMERARGVDIALLPVSGRFVMTAEEAARAAGIIKPAIAIPMHYGATLGPLGQVGSEEDARLFREKSPVRVEIL